MGKAPLNAARRDFQKKRKTKLNPDDVAATARAMNAARKRHAGGGGKPRTVEHIAGLPIGSRETIQVPYKRYKCMCLRCRIARGHDNKGSLISPTGKPRKR